MRNPFEVYTSLQGGKDKKPLDFEESAADSQSFLEEFVDADRSTPSLSWLRIVLFISFFLVGVKLFSLQIVNGASYRAISEDNRVRKQVVLAPRGIVKDRYSEVIAQNTASFNLVAIPFDLPTNSLPQIEQHLSDVFGIDIKEIQSKLSHFDKTSFDPLIIQQDISQQQSILFETKSSEFPGFQIQNLPIRDYLEPQVFSHILGYTGLISGEDLSHVNKTLYDTNDLIGKSGVELQYEQYLHGINGDNQVEVDATGKVLNVLGEDSPTPGNELDLNIDKGLQEQLYKSLTDDGKKNIKAAAVAINPTNGQVLAFLSLPGFDNNLFAHGIKSADYKNLLSDKDLPLFNRVIAGTYPPGSTVKPMAAAAALQEGIINDKTIINDHGVITIPNQYNPAISYQFRGWKPGGLGPLTVRSAIALSSDIFFYTVAGGYPKSAVPDGLGADTLASYYRKFNVGSLTGIDLQGEKPGVVPDPAWKAKYFKDDAILSKWYLGDTYHIGIGQGDMLVTPLQVAEWTSIIANNGTGYKPQIVNQVVDSSGNIVMKNKPEVLVHDIISPQNLKIVQEGMRQTVLAGTAKPLQTLPITSAGKTGTSQFDGSDPSRTHAWFTAYAPFEKPQIVITVLVEAGGEGNAVAEPVVKEALQWWAVNRYGK